MLPTATQWKETVRAEQRCMSCRLIVLQVTTNQQNPILITTSSLSCAISDFDFYRPACYLCFALTSAQCPTVRVYSIFGQVGYWEEKSGIPEISSNTSGSPKIWGNIWLFTTHRPQRSIETISSFDQWSGTIENH